MTTQIVTAEQQELHEIIDTLSGDALGKLASYAAFLKHEDWIEEQEDAEDIAVAEARRGEPTVPLSEIIKDYEAQHGPFNRV
jgi:hypothetical protein